MAERSDYHSLLMQSQALSEAIEIVSKLESQTPIAIETPEERQTQRQVASLIRQMESAIGRFKPHLGVLIKHAGVLSSVADAIDRGGAPTRDDMLPISEALVELESEFRVCSKSLERLEKWIDASIEDIAIEIAALTASLANVISVFQFSNAIAANNAVSEMYRQTVIQLLTSALEELKAPAVNSGRLQGIGAMLRRIMRKSAERKLGGELDDALDGALSHADKLADRLKDLPPMDGFF